MDFDRWNFDDAEFSAATFLNSALPQPLFFTLLYPEYDASHRALAWLENKRMLTQQEQAGQRCIEMGARTYVVVALGSIATRLHYTPFEHGRKPKRLI
jgi:Zn-dependent membrane protease YugP